MGKKNLPLRAKISDNIQTIAKTISAVLVIVGAAVGACTWGINQVMTLIEDRVSSIEQKIDVIELDTTRTQLLLLIQNTPTDYNSIFNVAFKYFQKLNGDWYMTTLFTKWANEQGVDVSNILNGAK